MLWLRVIHKSFILCMYRSEFVSCIRSLNAFNLSCTNIGKCRRLWNHRKYPKRASDPPASSPRNQTIRMHCLHTWHKLDYEYVWQIRQSANFLWTFYVSVIQGLPSTLLTLVKFENGVFTHQMFSVHNTLLFSYKNVVFPAQVEYSYFATDFRLKIFLYYS